MRNSPPNDQCACPPRLAARLLFDDDDPLARVDELGGRDEAREPGSDDDGVGGSGVVAGVRSAGAGVAATWTPSSRVVGRVAGQAAAMRVESVSRRTC